METTEKKVDKTFEGLLNRKKSLSVNDSETRYDQISEAEEEKRILECKEDIIRSENKLKILILQSINSMNWFSYYKNKTEESNNNLNDLIDYQFIYKKMIDNDYEIKICKDLLKDYKSCLINLENDNLPF